MGLKDKYIKLKIGLKLYQLYNLYEESTSMKEFLGSKKAKALIIGVVALVLVNIVGLDADQSAQITKALEIILSAYFVGQGVADFGKGAATTANKGEGV